MLKMVGKLQCLFVLVLGLLMMACSQNDASAAWRSYPDAVVNINQVDPAYRGYFRSQHGSNYSLRDQREAFMAATRTARTPVPKYVPRQAESKPKKSTARRGKTAAKGRGKASSRGRAKATSRKGKATKSKGKASASKKSKPAKKKAKAKSTKRRR